MKNILFKTLPLLAAILFATSCSKDDGNDNIPATPDNTTVAPDITTATPDNTLPDTPATQEPLQVMYDENGIPSVLFSISVGENTESLAKAGVVNDDGQPEQVFHQKDILKIKGENIEGELFWKKNTDSWSWGTAADFEGWLRGTGVTKLGNENVELEATLVNNDENNKGEAISVPKMYNNLNAAFEESGYWTSKFTFYKNETKPSIKLVQNTTFLKVTLEFSAKLRVETTSGDEYTFDIPYNNTTRIIAVPNGAIVSGDFMTARTVTAPTNGKCIHNITRTRPHNKCSYGAFSISKTKQVLFCQTNIGARNNGSYCSLFFQDNPWDIEHPQNMEVGNSHANVDKWDLFGWGTWLRKQTVTEANWTDDDGTKYVWPTGTDEHATANLSEESGEWYMLTDDEWDYVLNKRVMPMTSDGTRAPRYIRATMVDLYDDTKVLAKGIIIFPDDFNYSMDDMKTYVTKDYSSYTGPNAKFDENIVSGGNGWYGKSAMGAVFLPCAGYRSVTSINYSDNAGYYWTSYNDVHSGDAYALSFSNSNIQFEEKGRDYGYAVRLVHDLK